MHFKISRSQLSMLLCMTIWGYLPPVVASAEFKPLLTKISQFPTVTTLTTGSAWERTGKTQTFFLVPDVEKTYSANKTTDVIADVELFLGIQRSLSKILSGQIGFAFSATSNARLSGHIWDDADPQFDNYKYNYKIRHSEVAFKGILLADLGYSVTPWLAASLGLGFNRAHAFTNTPVIDTAVVMPNFSNHTTNSLAYSLGFGLQKKLAANWAAGAGYKFSDWGKAKLGKAVGQVFNTKLTEHHIYTHGVVFNISYSV